MPPTFRFLHITDRHCGAHDHQRLWELHRPVFFDDLKWCLDGQPLDAVFLTGDVANRAEVGEYLQATKNLKELQQYLMRLPGQGNRPIYLVVVPGNHDVQRPKAMVSKYQTVANALLTNIEERHKFSTNPFHLMRNHIRSWFENYVAWAEQIHEQSGFSKPIMQPTHSHMFPGEGAYSLSAGPYQIGIIGLNSACLHFYDCEPGNLLLTQPQVECPTADLQGWLLRHSIHVLLTHHPIGWLHDHKALQTYLSQRFHLHLSGHVHEAQGGVIRRFGHTRDHYQLVGRSWISQRYFAPETNEKPKPNIYMGYTLGSIELPELYTDPVAKFRVMARRFFQSADGHPLIAADPSISTAKVDSHPGTYNSMTEPQNINFKPHVVTVNCRIYRNDSIGKFEAIFDKTIKDKELTYEVMDFDGKRESKSLQIDASKPQPIGRDELRDHPQCVPWVFINYLDERPDVDGAGH